MHAEFVNAKRVLIFIQLLIRSVLPVRLHQTFLLLGCVFRV